MSKTFSLPSIATLQTIGKSLAALDLILVEEEYSFIRKFHYQPSWRKDKEAFCYSDGSEQNMIVVFAKEGCVIHGCDSELYDYEVDSSKLTELISDMPKALQTLMACKEIKRMKSTFLLWANAQETTDNEEHIWHYHPWLEHDGASDMLALFDPSLRTMHEHVIWLGYKLSDAFLEQLVGHQVIDQSELMLLELKLELSLEQEKNLSELGFICK